MFLSFLKRTHEPNVSLPAVSALCALLALAAAVFVRPSMAQPADRSQDQNLLTAIDHYQAGLYAVAADEFRRFRISNPEHDRAPDALFYEAASRLSIGQDEDAVALFETFESRYPLHPFAFQSRLTLGQYYFEEGRPEDAIRALTLVLERNPTDEQASRALYWLGEASVEIGREDEALSYFRRASEEFGETESAPRAAYALAFNQVRLGRYEEASRSFEDLSARFQGSEFARGIGLALAEVYYEIDDFERAVDELERRLPNLSGEQEDRAVFLLAESYNQLRNSGEAILNYRRFTEGDPSNPYYRRALFGLAWNYHLEASYEWAGDNFELVAASGDDDLAAQATYYQAVNRKLENRYQEAVGLFESFVRRWPEHELGVHGWFELGLLRYELNRWREASDAFSHVIDDYPDSDLIGEALLHRGNAFIALGDFDAALSTFDEAIELNAAPESLKEDIIFQKAWLLYRNRDYEQSAPEFLRLFEKHSRGPQAGESLFWAAESFFQLNRFERAGSLFRQYLRDFPGARHEEAAHYALGWTYFRQRAYERAIPEFETFLAAYRDDNSTVPYRSDAQLRLADSYFALKRYPEAVRVYGRMAGDGDDYALFQIGQAYSNAGDTFEAVSTFRQLLEEYPISEWREEAQYSLGYLYFLSEDYEQAVSAYRVLIETYPRDPLAAKAQYGIGDAFFNEGNLGAAVDAYNEVLNRYPNSPFTADAAAGIQFAFMASGEEERADELVDRFAENHPDSPVIDRLRFRQAEVKYQSGRVDEALAEFERFVEEALDEELLPGALYYIGVIQADRNENESAISYFRQLVDRFQNSQHFVDAAARLGHLLLENDDPEGAEEVFGRLERLHGDESGVVALARYGRSRALSRLGRSAEAESLLQEAIDAAPDADESIPAYLGLARIRSEHGDIDEAERLFEFVVTRSRDETGAEALLLLGSSQLERGEPERAVETLGRMPALYAGYSDWVARGYLKQAEALEILGSRGEAIRVYDTVLSLYPDTEYSEAAQTAKSRLGVQ